jgi:type I restriction enzyme M protein
MKIKKSGLTKPPRVKEAKGKKLAGPQSVNAAIKSICDIMRRSNCAGAMHYVPELTWILFLRILDYQEMQELERAEAVGDEFTPSLKAPYRWQDWAAPAGAMRQKLQKGTLGEFFTFVNGELLPYLKKLEKKPNATPKQKVISEIISSVERVRIDTEKNFCDVLDKIHELRSDAIDTTHVFAISQVYEGLLLKMGEKNNDGGQFFTPREIIRAMARAIDPQVGETVYDPCCGTGGFLAQAYEFMAGENNAKVNTPEDLDTLKHRTFFGREKENLIYPIGLANLMLHGIDAPHIWHGNTLTRKTVYDGLWQDAPAVFDVVLTNPPFGGKEGPEAQTNYVFKTGATQMLFLQEIINVLRPEGGRAAVVMDEGVLFRTNETAFVQTKRKLLNDCNLWCILSLPGGVFTNAGAGVKTNLLFFTKGQSTKKIWYYDLSDIKVGKKTPFTLDRFDEFFRLLPTHGDSAHSWTMDINARKAKATVEAAPFKKEALIRRQEANQWKDQLAKLKQASPRDAAAIATTQEKIAALSKEEREWASKAQAIEDAVFDLKAVNPNVKIEEDKRTPSEIITAIEACGSEIGAALAQLKGLAPSA